ncbi:hypothetical protein ACIQ2D_16115 [Lysinibacillus sp. NPDC097287]|uniref:hypothetical protein n=1 Tax=Lysinibacillus sp. NPDC097287 TaxID=3364144 RepID=UPI0037F5A3E9
MKQVLIAFPDNITNHYQPVYEYQGQNQQYFPDNYCYALSFALDALLNPDIAMITGTSFE